VGKTPVFKGNMMKFEKFERLRKAQKAYHHRHPNPGIINFCDYV